MIVTSPPAPQRSADALTFDGPELTLDRRAVAENLRRMRRGGPVMAVVKADGYGHGAVAVASAAVRAGATWVGVTDVAEAVPLRATGIEVPLLAWLHPGGVDTMLATEHCVDLAVGSPEELRRLIDRASRAVPLRVHLHFDIGMARGGCQVGQWAELIAVARHGHDSGRIRAVGAMGHLPDADRADPAVNAASMSRLRHARDAMVRAGLPRPLMHVGGTAAALTDPGARGDLIRVGAGLVGIDPSGRSALAAAGRFTAPVVHSTEVGARIPVGYGGTYITDRRTCLAVLGVGYADGIPREISPHASVEVDGRRHRIVGRVSMDQVVIDTGDILHPPGTKATVFGAGGVAPSLEEWADWAGTIAHTIVTGIGPRVRRTVA